jgi:N-acetylglucosaminyldiphosphoundecaprenol N-acetyl-beta-D-mannosaminyltransferase
MISETNILGIKVNTFSKDEALYKLEQYLDNSGHHIVCTVNSEFIINSLKDTKFKEIINNQSSMNIADSFGILWASWFLSLNYPQNIFGQVYLIFVWFFSLFLIPFFPNIFKSIIPEKISGSDFIWDISRLAAKKSARVFLYGGEITIAERCALKLQTDISDLRVVGVEKGKPLPDPHQIISKINDSRADILMIAIGSPTQEKWLSEYLPKTCCKIGIGLGGTFDFVSGATPRAPKWMQKSGLEWFFRLIIEPRRIKRQLALPKMFVLVLIKKLHKR